MKRLGRVGLAVVALSMLAGVAMAQPAQDITDRIRRHDWKGLFAVVSSRAQSGDALAARQLGALYYGACDAAQDMAQAAKWYGKAAQQNDPVAQRMIGSMTFDGLGGVAKDEAKGLAWYQKAAAQNEPFAQLAMGKFYQGGQHGLAKDDAKALEHYRAAAMAGNGQAMNFVASFYAVGKGGVPKDEKVAVDWLRKAGQAGDPIAEYNLGHNTMTG